MDPIQITLLLLLFATLMFAWEKIPLAVTSVLVCLCLAFTGVLDARTAFHGFVDPNVILFVSMFVVGAALFETGMANRIGSLVTRFARTETRLIVAIMAIAALLSGVLSNTGTAAILIPVVLGIASRPGFSRARLLMPLAFATAIGGNLTLIGSPGNLIAQSALAQIGREFAFFEYAKIGLPMLIVGILYFRLLGHRLLPDRDEHPADLQGQNAGGEATSPAVAQIDTAPSEPPPQPESVHPHPPPHPPIRPHSPPKLVTQPPVTSPASPDARGGADEAASSPDAHSAAALSILAPERTPRQTPPPWKPFASLLILVATILGMVFERQIGLPLHLVGAAGALAMVLCRVLTEQQAYAAIDSRTIFIFGGTLSLAAALDQTGAGAVIANTILAGLGSQPSPVLLLVVIFSIACTLTNFMSNTATAALLVPIGLSIANTLSADPRAMLMAIVIGCSCAYATPVATPANTMVLVAGHYRFMDYVRVGVPLILLMCLVCVPLLLFFFPFFP